MSFNHQKEVGHTQAHTFVLTVETAGGTSTTKKYTSSLAYSANLQSVHDHQIHTC